MEGKCQSTTIEAVEKLGNDLVKKDWLVDGKPYNLKRRGWTFTFTNRKKSMGSCYLLGKRVTISIFKLKSNLTNIDIWADTIKHEIAHAIDYEIRGKSDHGEEWKNIARQVGCIDELCHKGDKLEVNGHKYTLQCDNCGTKTHIHRKRKKVSACKKCCTEHNNGEFTPKFTMGLVVNF